MDIPTGTLEEPLAHPARVALRAVDEGVAAMAEANLWSLSDRELLDLRIDAERVRSRLDAATLAVTRELDARGAAVATGATSTAAWLRGRCRQHPGAAKAEVRLAGELDASLPRLRAALAAGEVSLDAAHAVADGVRGLPAGVDAATSARGEAFLVAQARLFDPGALAKLAKHLVHVLDPAGGCELEREEARRSDAESFTVVHGHDGGRRLHGRLTAEHGALLDEALGVLAAPRPAADGTPDPRPADKRRADALMELVRIGVAAPELPCSGGDPVTMTVTTTPDHLAALAALAGRAGPAGSAPVAAHLDDGTPLSPESTRRLGCDAWLQAAVLDSAGAVLHLGRRTRLVNGPLRRAVVLRDHGCAFPGCGRPARWCQAHHVVHWAHEGTTDIDNLVLLCAHHHRVIHHDGWSVVIGPDRLPVFTPPRWIDPDQTPRPAWRPPTHLRV